MRRNAWLGLFTVVLLAALPLLAGDHKKCSYSTQDCLDHMAAHMKNSGWVGVELDVDEETGVMTLNKVVPGSPAEAADLRPGDQLIALNGVAFGKENQDAIKAAKKEWKPGQSITYTVKRAGLDRQVNLTLAPMPADVLAAWIGNHMLEHANMELAKNTGK